VRRVVPPLSSSRPDAADALGCHRNKEVRWSAIRVRDFEAARVENGLMRNQSYLALLLNLHVSQIGTGTQVCRTRENEISVGFPMPLRAEVTGAVSAVRYRKSSSAARYRTSNARMSAKRPSRPRAVVLILYGAFLRCGASPRNSDSSSLQRAACSARRFSARPLSAFPI
jgi:hypothetical protein